MLCKYVIPESDGSASPALLENKHYPIDTFYYFTIQYTLV